MATGSRRWFQYTSDAGTLHSVELDESTYENPALGFTAIDVTDPNYRGPINATATRPLQMRRLLLKGLDVQGNVVSRQVYVGATDATAWTTPEAFQITLNIANGPANGTRPFTPTTAIGERRAVIPAQDTGMNDNDTDDNFVSAPAP